MISGLLIIILERTQMIGLLKALGARNKTIRHTFLWFATFIIGRGLLLGDVIGIGLVLLQQLHGPYHPRPADLLRQRGSCRVEHTHCRGSQHCYSFYQYFCSNYPKFLYFAYSSGKIYAIRVKNCTKNLRMCKKRCTFAQN